MSKEIREEVVLEFEKIISDDNVPKNIKSKIDNIITIFNEQTSKEVQTNKALQELEEISEESNMPDHVRTQLWGIVSLLESIQ
ncbi:MAG: hypothetical protein CMH64_02020 [Nanoarchaeota archaeon]|nr:hypothetical protein [Nanoarchaeota archaeon]|tara:strand:- start:121 stop:369 length:249 start_codon:yes stop_codon:yes gene_type:complete